MPDKRPSPPRNDGSPRRDESSAVNSDDPRLVAAVREFMADLEKGSAPSRQEFLARHKEIAADLAVCLDGLEMVHSAAVKVRRRPTPPPLLAGANPAQPLGDFQIVREIGRGGMGVVYEAFQLSLGRRVALKVLPFAASLDPSRLERFRNEAQAAAQLHHTNIVPVYSVGIDRGVHFYAMQLIDGQALSASIADMRRAAGRTSSFDPSATEPGAARSAARSIVSGRSASSQSASHPNVNAAHVETRAPGSTMLSHERSTPANYFRTVARLVQQAATALEHAHGMGVVHRDIKPGNLLLDKRGALWVTDFGLAQFHTDAELTRTGDLLGTLRYMSPEQATGGRVLLDHRTDIYSLGATMYEVLTLEPIFDSGDRNVLLRRIIEDEPRAPRLIDKTIPTELETIVLKATAKSPAERYATAQQFADDLQRWLDDKPILARRPALAERVRRWGRRHRAVVRAAAVMLSLGVLGLLVAAIIIAHLQANTDAAYRSEKAARKSEAHQREAAEASFRQARQAIDAFTELTNEEMAAKPALGKLRRKFLEKSLEYYNAFLKERANDPALSGELKAASDRVSRIVDELAALDELAPLMLLDDPQVQDDLKIPADRRPEIESLLTQVYAERERATAANPSGHETAVASVTEELRSNGEKLRRLLSQQQIGRLKQIAWQQQGAQAFKSPDIIAALQLTPDEQTKIDDIIERHRSPGSRDPGADLGNHKRQVPPDDKGPPEDPERRGPAGRMRPDERFSPDDRGPPGPPDGPGDFGGPDNGPPGAPPDGPHRDRPPKPPPAHVGPKPEFDPPRDESPDDPPEVKHERRTIEEILAVLTADQRTAWKNLVGEPFMQHRPGGRQDPPRIE